MIDNEDNPYLIADTFMLRVPLFPLHVLVEIGTHDIDEVLKKYYSKPEVREALFLASPELYNRCLHWLEGDDFGLKSLNKFRFSLMKYLVRMSSRCTPFGMFAGIAAGHFSQDDEIQIGHNKNHQLFARPDMHYLCTVSAEIQKNRELRSEFMYTVNNSLYPFAHGYRYIEYFTDSKGIRNYQLQEICQTPELEKVIDFSRRSSSFNDLVGTITSEEIPADEATAYIHALIDNQVVLTDLEPVVSGNQYLHVLNDKLDKYDHDHSAVKDIDELTRLFKAMGKSDAKKRISIYHKAMSIMRSGHENIPPNSMIQADMRLDTGSLTLRSEVRNDLLNILPLLMWLHRKSGKGSLSRFRDAFVNRYGQAEVPLLVALDTEAGPGYLAGDQLAHASDLLRDVMISPKKNDINELVWTDVDTMLLRKLHQALLAGSEHIEIGLDDLDEPGPDNREFPMSFSALARICGQWAKEGEKHLIHLVSAGGSSALALSGRFSHMDETLQDAMMNIAAREQDHADESILAEIVHLPQQRTGNILMRPAFRDYEIPYMACPAVDDDHAILPADLMLSVQDNKFMIRSIRLNKYVIPRISNAHNYSMSTLPVYRFLCDMQSQQTSTAIGFNWGPLEHVIPYLPRVSHRNFILYPASWNLMKKDLAGIVNAGSDDDLLKAAFRLRERFRIHSEVVLLDGDNELYIDLCEVHYLELLRNEVRNLKRITLQEFLFSKDHSLVSSESGSFANEFVFFYYKDADKKW